MSCRCTLFPILFHLSSWPPHHCVHLLLLAKNDKPVKALGHDPSIVHYSSGSAPKNHGSSAREAPEDDVNQDDCQDYDFHICEELHNRVFVDFEVFMKSVLHVPHDWKDVWGLAIAVVKTNGNFAKCHAQYCQKCNQPGLHKKSFYTPFVDTMNTVLDALSGSGIVAITPQCYPITDSIVVLCGVTN